MQQRTQPQIVPGVEWFRTLAETASVAVFVYSRDRFLFVNPESARLTGYTVEELLRLDSRSLVHPDFHAAIPRLDDDPTEPRIAARPVELRIVCRNGEERWIAFTAARVELDGVRAGLGTAVDITEAKRAQQALARRLDLENLLAEVSHRFLQVEPADLDDAVIDALGRITRATGADRCRLLRTAPGESSFACTHEWSRFGQERPPSGAHIASITLPWSGPRLASGKVVAIIDAQRLPDDASGELHVAAAEGVRAVLGVPMMVADRLDGCLRLEVLGRPRRWRDADRRLLVLSAAIVGSALHRHRALQDLQASRDWLELAQHAGRSIAWEWHPADDRILMSAHVAEVFGVDPTKVPSRGRELLSYVPRDEYPRLAQAARRTFKLDEPYAVEHRILIPDGGECWLVVHGQAVRDASGWVVRMIGVSADITERKQAEAELQREKEHAQVTLASIGDGVIRTDAHGRIDFMNPAAQNLTGFRTREASGRPVGEIYRVRDEATGRMRPNLVELCLGEGRVMETSDPVALLRHDGSELAVHDSAAPIRDASGRTVGSVLVFQDVTRLRSLEREMAHLALHDPLTGLINRREFENRLNDAIRALRRNGRRFALCYLDLDDFKIVNDTCGHGAGDELLRQLAGILTQSIRPCDTVARLGGDEFAVLLADCQIPDARRLADQLLGAVTRHRFAWEDRMFSVGASIGVIPLADPSATMAQLLSAADSACYVAKDRGRNQIYLSEPDDTELAARKVQMQWMERIGRALEDGRLRLYHQPIRSLSGSLSPSLSEILLRLVDVDGTVYEACQFMTAAERFRLMPTIDRWVVENALATLGRLHRQGRLNDVCYAVNLSGQSLGEQGFLEFIAGQLELHGVPGEAVSFEITETSAITNMAFAQKLIASLRQRGCRFVLDDFGSGLSSFRYLSRLEVDYVKIDGAIVRAMLDEPVLYEMVASIHRIGRRMGLKTIGEWVERDEILDALRLIGVDYAQGFLLAVPEPFQEIQQ